MNMVGTDSHYDLDNNGNGSPEAPDAVCEHVKSNARAHRRGFHIHCQPPSASSSNGRQMQSINDTNAQMTMATTPLDSTNSHRMDKTKTDIVVVVVVVNNIHRRGGPSCSVLLMVVVD